MRRLILSRAKSLLAVAVLASGIVADLSADDYIDDSALKTAFEENLEALYRAGGIPTASETHRQLRAEAQAPFSLADLSKRSSTLDRESPLPPIPVARAATLILGHLYLCSECQQHHSSTASGVILSADGLALTNYHVLNFRGAIVYGAMSKDGTIYALDEVIASNKQDDLALVRLRGATNLPHVSLGETIETGSPLFLVSHPDGHFFSVTRGFLSRKYLTPVEKTPRLQITADFAQGSSGAGIFNESGELVGIAATTSSIYYHGEDEAPSDLQMVVKSGVPIESLTKLLQTSERTRP